MILKEIRTSTVKNKRFVAIFDDPPTAINFGAYSGITYIDGASDAKKSNYIKRHKKNEDWEQINAGSLSRIILWGDSHNIHDNILYYIKKFNV